MKQILTALFLFGALFVVGQDSIPPPIEDTEVTEAIQDAVDSYDKVTEALPDQIVSIDDLRKYASLIFGVVSMFFTRLFRKNENVLDWIVKIKSNGVLHLISAAVASLIGVAIIPPEGGLQVGTIFNFAISVMGISFLLYQVTRLLPGIGKYIPVIKGVLEQIFNLIRTPKAS